MYNNMASRWVMVVIFVFCIFSCCLFVSSPASPVYNFMGDLSSRPLDDYLSSPTTRAQQKSPESRLSHSILYALDEHYEMDSASSLHSKWWKCSRIDWYFDCDSITAGIKGAIIPPHIIYNNQSKKLEWVRLNKDQFCSVMYRLVDNALHEWLDPLAERIGHAPVYNNHSTTHSDSAVLVISFVKETQHHHRNHSCNFDGPNVLAHATDDFIHINGQFQWCVLGSKAPRYLLQTNNIKGDLHLLSADQFDATYGLLLKQVIDQTPPNCLNLYAVLLHELGHSLGLGHATKPSSLMYPIATDPLNYVHASDFTFIAQLYRN